MVRNSYSAELGGASGGVINIISKSGRNNFFGSAFGSSAQGSTRATLSFQSWPIALQPPAVRRLVRRPDPAGQDFFFTAVERLSQAHRFRQPAQRSEHIPADGVAERAAQLPERRSVIRQLAAGLRGALTTTAAANPRTVTLYQRQRAVPVRRIADAVLGAARPQLRRTEQRLPALQPD